MEMGGCSRDSELAAARENVGLVMGQPAQKPKPKILLSKVYHGFEDASDIERDVSEMFVGKGILGEFQGSITVTVTYVEADPT